MYLLYVLFFHGLMRGRKQKHTGTTSRKAEPLGFNPEFCFFFWKVFGRCVFFAFPGTDTRPAGLVVS